VDFRQSGSGSAGNVHEGEQIALRSAVDVDRIRGAAGALGRRSGAGRSLHLHRLSVDSVSASERSEAFPVTCQQGL
jgi:hypothetical protein